MLARLAAFVFGIIEILLLIRLALPFVDVPKSLQDWVPGLITVTDWLVSPFQVLVKPFDLGPVSHDLSSFGGGLGTYINQLDSGVVVAMIGWGVIAAVVTLILSLLSRH